MRRPSVHKVEFEFTGEVTTWAAGRPLGVLKVPQEGYRTRCGMRGGAELLKLDGSTNGAGRWCGGCYPSSIIDPRSTSRWASRWTRD